MPCPRCGKFDSNKYCDPCIREIVLKVQESERQILNMAIMFAGFGEKGYLANKVVYTDSKVLNTNSTGLDQQQTKEATKHGRAEGFSAVGKKFTLIGQGAHTPSQAVKTFIFPTTITVCECRTFMSALYCNAARIVLNKISPLLFDDVFPTLQISSNDDDDVMKFMTFRQITEKDIAQVMPGDWIWVPNPDPAYRDVQGLGLVRSGAASGWNLICVTTLPERKYIGFGLSEGHVQAMTLDEIMAFLQKEANKNKSSKSKEIVDFGPKTRRGSMELPKTTSKALLDNSSSLLMMANAASLKWKLYSLNAAASSISAGPIAPGFRRRGRPDPGPRCSSARGA